MPHQPMQYPLPKHIQDAIMRHVPSDEFTEDTTRHIRVTKVTKSEPGSILDDIERVVGEIMLDQSYIEEHYPEQLARIRAWIAVERAIQSKERTDGYR